MREFRGDESSGPGIVSGLDKEDWPIAPAPLMDLLQAVMGRGTSIELRAKGFSMDPFIKDGDVLTLSPLRTREPRLGEVVAFKLPEAGKISIHRVIHTKADSCLIKGDCCSEPDGFIPKTNILGLVNRIDRAGRRIRFGLGLERALIAFLSRRGMLWPLGSSAFKKISFRSSAE